MLEKYLYVSGKSKLSQFNYSVRFWESKMIVRVLPVEQNWRGGGEKEKKKLMKLTCLVEIQFYGWTG